MKKLSRSEKLVYYSLGLVAIIGLSIFGWEQVREDVVDRFTGETQVVEQQDKQPTTIDGLIEEQAHSWLKSPEALKYAKAQVTEKVVEELSKL